MHVHGKLQVEISACHTVSVTGIVMQKMKHNACTCGKNVLCIIYKVMRENLVKNMSPLARNWPMDTAQNGSNGCSLLGDTASQSTMRLLRVYYECATRVHRKYCGVDNCL